MDEETVIPKNSRVTIFKQITSGSQPSTVIFQAYKYLLSTQELVQMNGEDFIEIKPDLKDIKYSVSIGQSNVVRVYRDIFEN